ncbi:MAG: hypothetical protein LBK71_01735 [Verrucomicrobiales bacterium]|jgi:ribosomal protein L11 methylase PrmA|nr:hypothetical protein [Verrucomicrobiales bacterium]
MTTAANSYRDPDGFILFHNGKHWRVLMPAYRQHYERFIGSGLYDHLAAAKKIVAHTESAELLVPGQYKVLLPEQLPLISYSYAWCFEQLKAAALLTLDIQAVSLAHGMSLKDATSFNVQFQNGRAIFIDTSSFEIYEAGRPWQAYGQFCRHFLAPLALMAMTDAGLHSLLETNLDGIDLGLCGKLLPGKSWLNTGLMAHIHLHARAIAKQSAADGAGAPIAKPVTKVQLLNIIEHLRLTIEGLTLSPRKTTWDDYYECNNNYSQRCFADKENWLVTTIKQLPQKQALVWDIGANNGHFSRLIAPLTEHIVSMDFDANAVNDNFRANLARGITNILPLQVDLTNPFPRRGWALAERGSLFDLPKPDLLVALALIHHLAIGNNLPLGLVMKTFADITRKYLVIEFVEKHDGQVQKLLARRKDIFPGYHLDGFKEAALKHFAIVRSTRIQDTPRHLFLLEKI